MPGVGIPGTTPGVYEDVCCGAKPPGTGPPYAFGPPFNPVPLSASGGGGVFSRCAIGSGAAGAAGLYAIGAG